MLWKGSYSPYLQIVFSVFQNYGPLNYFSFLFVTIGVHGSGNLKTILLPHLWFFFNQPFSKYSLLTSSLKLLIGILNFFKQIEIFVNTRPCGSENFKAPILLKWWFFLSNILFNSQRFQLTVPCNSPHKSYPIGYFEISNLLEKKIEILHCAQWDNEKLPRSWK